MDLRIVAIVVVVAAAAAVAVASAFCVCHVSQSANNILSNNLGFSYLARDAFDSVMFLLQLCTMFVLSCNLPCNYFIALSLFLSVSLYFVFTETIRGTITFGLPISRNRKIDTLIERVSFDYERCISYVQMQIMPTLKLLDLCVALETVFLQSFSLQRNINS